MSGKRLLLVHTGGTIGMVPGDNGLVPSDGFEALLRQRLGPRLSSLPDFDLIELSPLIDSAELVPAQWRTIAEAIVSRYNEYDGFVVLHGTDTLAYTASALSFMLQGLDRPVILTGSQIPLSRARNDAEAHLLATLELAVRPELNEVCLYFNGRLLRGNRAVKVDATALAAFDSPNFPPLGEMGISLRLRQDLLLPRLEQQFSIPAFDNRAVAVLRLYPGIQTALLQSVLAQPGLRALILQSYGVGNAPVATPGLLDTLAQATAQGILIVNLSQCGRGEVASGTYATGSALAQSGVISGADLTLEAAFAKLHWLLAEGKTPAEGDLLMRQALCGEQRGALA